MDSVERGPRWKLKELHSQGTWWGSGTALELGALPLVAHWEMLNNELSAGGGGGEEARFAVLADCCGVSAAISTNSND